ncbi:MAG: hypothetical protein Q9169_005742 [Polycauliona sp. 2 TL-2023]
MAASSNIRIVETLELSQFQRQLFQWYFYEKKTWPQIKQCGDLLFQRLEETTSLTCDISERQWENHFRKWNKIWGLKKDHQGDQVSLPDGLGAMPLWYERDQELLHFHAFAYLPGIKLEIRRVSVQASCLQAYVPPAVPLVLLVRTLSTPAMVHTYPGPPPAAPYAAVPNVLNNWPSGQGSRGTLYPQSMGVDPSYFNSQGYPQPLFRHNTANGNRGAQLPYRNATPMLPSSEIPAEPRRATPVSRKRSRRNSPEPKTTVEAAAEGEDHLNSWLTEPNLF